jgi:hypothetical protein
MSSLLNEQLAVSVSGEYWDVEGGRLWKSTDASIVLYSMTRPRLTLNQQNGRVQASLTVFRKWKDGVYATMGGTALLTIGMDVDEQQPGFGENLQQWRRVLLNRGYTGSSDPKFLPLPIRNRRMQVVMDPASGRVSPNSRLDDAELGVGSAAVLLELTDTSAAQWARGIKLREKIAGAIKITYEYPRLMPAVGARVLFKGQRAYYHLSQALHPSHNGVYGSDAEIRQAWDDLFADGSLSITLVGSLPPELESQRQALLDTFGTQARQTLFDKLFEAIPTTQVAAAGQGATARTAMDYAFKWRTVSEATDFDFNLNVEAWNWLNESMEADFTTLIAPLDESYINTVYAEVSVPVSISVDPDPQVAGVTVSLDYATAAGQAPESAVFDKNGGTAELVLTSSRPDTLKIGYTARVTFAHPQWPVLETSGSATVAQGGNCIVLRTKAWVRRQQIYLYLRDGNRIKQPSEMNPNDYLVLTVVCDRGDGRPAVKESLRITPEAPVEFSYPVSPNGPAGSVKIAVLGVIDGKMVQPRELEVTDPGGPIFVLAAADGVRLVAKDVVLAEDDPLAERLRQAGARPVLEEREAGAISEAPVSIEHELELVPQPTTVSCWAASLTMLINFRDKMSHDPADVASAAGMDLDTGYGWDQIRGAVATWGLHEDGPASAMPSMWADLLRAHGPIWIVEVGAPYHAVVLAGIDGDGTPDGTSVTVYNPWPPQQGAIEYQSFLDFDSEFGLGAGAGAAIVYL